MERLIVFSFVLGAIIFLGVVILLANRQDVNRKAVKQLVQYRELVDTLREMAFEHREITDDSPLAVQIIDEIRVTENRMKRKGLMR